MFSSTSDPIEDSIQVFFFMVVDFQRIETVMNCSLDRSTTKGRLIRDVGPNKMMTLISFRLTDAMVHRTQRKRECDQDEHDSKKTCYSIVC